MKKTVVIVALCGVLWPAVAGIDTYTVGLNFGADEPNGAYDGELLPSEVAGVVPQANWNNLTFQNGTATGIVADNRGTAVQTSIQVQWESNNTWSTTGRGEENNGFPAGPDRKLMIGYLDTGNDTTTRITITGIPQELLRNGYDVYVYALGGVGGRGGGYWIENMNGQRITDIKLGTAPTNPSQYIEDPGIDHTDTGNYLVFRGLMENSIVIIATTVGPYGYGGTERAPVNAVQLVARSESAPEFGLPQARGDAVSITVRDVGSASIDPARVQASVDGKSVKVQVSKTGGITTITYKIFEQTGRCFEPGSKHQLLVSVTTSGGETYSHLAEFTVPQYVLVPEDYALSSASERGMTARLYMIPASRGGNSLALAELQWARGIIDPTNNVPYANLIAPDTFQVDKVNWALMRSAPALYPLDIDDTPEDGPDHFNTALPPSSPIPNDWIPGTELFEASQVVNLVAEVVCYLRLKPGYYRMGVNSDDGFRVSVAPGQPDVFGLTLGLYDGGRGASDTLFDFLITKDGYYPFRLLWWQGTGGASVEWFAINLDSGEYVLINGPQAGAIEAYRSSPGNRAHVRLMLPPNGLPGLLGGERFKWEIEDGTTQVAPNSVRVIWNGVEQTNVVVTKSGNVTTVSWTLPEKPVQPGTIATISGQLIFGETNGAVRTNEFSFQFVGWLRPWLTPQPQPEFAIGINFGADEPNGQNLGGLADDEVAGIIPQSHWNNLTGNSGSISGLRASKNGSVVTTSTSVEWTSNNTWASTGRGEENNGLPTGPDRKLMLGYLDTPTDGSTRVTIRNIPQELISSGYDLYIYALGGVSGRGGGYRIEDLDGNVVAPSSMVPDLNGTMFQVVPFVCSSQNIGYFECPGLPDRSVPGNYIVFRGLKASDIVVVATTQGEWPGTDRAPINAIQLVKAIPTGPVAFKRIALLQDGKVTLEWEGAATLLEADDLAGPWRPVTGASSPYVVVPSGSKKFYRLMR